MFGMRKGIHSVRILLIESCEGLTRISSRYKRSFMLPAGTSLRKLLNDSKLYRIHQADAKAVQPAGADRYGGSAVATRWPHRVVEVLDLRMSDVKDVPWRTLAVVVPLPGEGDLLFVGTTLSWRLSAEAARERQVAALTTESSVSPITAEGSIMCSSDPGTLILIRVAEFLAPLLRLTSRRRKSGLAIISVSWSISKFERMRRDAVNE